MRSSKPSVEAKPARVAAPKKSSTRRQPVSQASDHAVAPISADERRRMIEVCAYFRAQQRGFVPGNEQQDWLDAEAQIDAQLMRPTSRASRAAKGLA